MLASPVKIIVAAAALVAMPALAAEHVTARLVADRAAIAPGDTFRIGVHFAIPEKAHIYWWNPGDSGLPTVIEWTLPSGFQLQRLHWPNPQSFTDEVLGETTFGYAEEIVLFTVVRAPFSIRPGDAISVRAEVSWLVCLDDGACIPEGAQLNAELAVQESFKTSPDAELIDRFAARVPTGVADAAVPLNIVVEGQPSPRVRVEVEAPWQAEFRGTEFFPDRGGAWRLQSGTAENVAEFAPSGPVEASATGAVTLVVVNPDTGERSTVFVRFGSPEAE